MAGSSLSIPVILLTTFIFRFNIFSSDLESRNSLEISPLISEQLFNSIFLHIYDTRFPANNFYTYSSFVEAAKCFPTLGNAGDLAVQKREIAAFLAQISHYTNGGWDGAPGSPYAWGLCYKENIIDPDKNYCNSTYKQWPCYPNKSYHGRKAIQLSWNYNYGPAGKALRFDGLKNPEIVSDNNVIAFWFWMTAQKPKPSCHHVMIGRYSPSAGDLAANRTAGYWLVTNIINGGMECEIPDSEKSKDRIGYFKRYAELFNVDTGPNLDCACQKPF